MRIPSGVTVLLLVLCSMAQAETTQCTPITTLPATIAAAGSYCLNGDLASSATGSLANFRPRGFRVGNGGAKRGFREQQRTIDSLDAIRNVARVVGIACQARTRTSRATDGAIAICSNAAESGRSRCTRRNILTGAAQIPALGPQLATLTGYAQRCVR